MKSEKLIGMIYWGALTISILIIFNNFGLYLYITGFLILGALLFHIIVGTRINQLVNNKFLLTLSSINLMLFSLVRIDGVHATSGSGLSEFLQLLDLNIYYKGNDSVHLLLTLVTYIIQLSIDGFLYKKSKVTAQELSN